MLGLIDEGADVNSPQARSSTSDGSSLGTSTSRFGGTSNQSRLNDTQRPLYMAAINSRIKVVKINRAQFFILLFCVLMDYVTLNSVFLS